MAVDFFGEHLKRIREIREEAPSKNVKDWLRNYWTVKNEHFWTAVHNDLILSIPMKPFTLYAQADQQARVCHELAHLVTCHDDDIFDPHWGIHEFNLGVSHRGFTETAAIKEIEVLTIEHIILKYIQIHLINYQYVPRKFESTFRDIYNIISPYTDLSKDQIENLVNRANTNWSIEEIWRELNRKYALIDARKQHDASSNRNRY